MVPVKASWRWALVTAVAPITWGSTYFVTAHFLPADIPLWGSALRALPAGLVLLLLARRLPHGSWWWRSVVLGVLNFGGFFTLIYLSAILLPSSVAASIMALAPLVMAGLGWLVLAERPTGWMAAGAALGILGVLAILGAGLSPANPWGVLTSLTALVMSSVGAVLNKKWTRDVPVLASTAWQATVGGVMLVVVAALVEGPMPALSGTELLGFAYISLIATALASVCWFAGLRRLAAGTVGIVGLLNPVTGVALGTLAAGEQLTWWQGLGMGLVLIGILVGRRESRPRPSAADAA
jgi:probable blue pigment (indigoidine) exporter